MVKASFRTNVMTNIPFRNFEPIPVPTFAQDSAAGIVKNKPDPEVFFGGQKIVAIRGTVISMALVDYPEPRQCRRHAHDGAFFALLLSGSYVEISGCSTLSYRGFTLGFHPPDTVHTDQVQVPKTKVVLFQLSAEVTSLAKEHWRDRGSGPRLCNAHGSWLATLLYQEFQRAALCPLTEESLALEMLSTAFPDDHHRGRPIWLQDALDLLHGDFASRLTVIGIARELGLHPIYLSRQFRRYCGQSIGEFVHRLRLCWAAEQLRNSEMPLAELALAAGYADQSQFQKAFKRQTGTTPAQFRSNPTERRQV
jgi:AraC family transcriptional regulator